MNRLKAAVLSAALALPGLALLAGPVLSQTVYVPPNAPQPRFGGEFRLAEVGPVAGYWRSECYNWHVRSQARRGGPAPPPPVDAALKRFVSGIIADRPDYDDLSPAMAQAVREHLPTYWPSLNRMGRATVARQFETTKEGDALYVLDQAGGGTHWNVTVNPDGKIARAFLCGGQGL
jgi:hypothetical protein